MVQNVVEESKSTFLWVAFNDIIKSLKRDLKTYIQNHITFQQHHNEDREEVAAAFTQLDIPSNQPKGGCPNQYTHNKKKCLDLDTDTFFSEVALKCAEEKDLPNARLKKGCFNEIAEETRKAKSTVQRIAVSKTTIDRHRQRKNLMLNSISDRKESPLAPYKITLQIWLST